MQKTLNHVTSDLARASSRLVEILEGGSDVLIHMGNCLLDDPVSTLFVNCVLLLALRLHLCLLSLEILLTLLAFLLMLGLQFFSLLCLLLSLSLLTCLFTLLHLLLGHILLLLLQLLLLLFLGSFLLLKLPPLCLVFFTLLLQLVLALQLLLFTLTFQHGSLLVVLALLFPEDLDDLLGANVAEHLIERRGSQHSLDSSVSCFVCARINQHLQSELGWPVDNFVHLFHNLDLLLHGLLDHLLHGLFHHLLFRLLFLLFLTLGCFLFLLLFSLSLLLLFLSFLLLLDLFLDLNLLLHLLFHFFLYFFLHLLLFLNDCLAHVNCYRLLSLSSFLCLKRTPNIGHEDDSVVSAAILATVLDLDELDPLFAYAEV
mmetsp:Transcript_16673/g.29790  ORF Transcript_16673/g.29790 Transcript_16673/m.29790 type:complete len:371 (-) Transcript_16673:725-1837(-)